MNFYLSARTFLCQYFAGYFSSLFGSSVLIFAICTPRQDN